MYSAHFGHCTACSSSQLFYTPPRCHVQTRGAVDKARGQVAMLINAQPRDVYFTSCGTESDNWAIWGAVMRARMATGVDPNTGGTARKPHVVTSAIEHPAVTACLRYLAAQVQCSCKTWLRNWGNGWGTTTVCVSVSLQGLLSFTEVGVDAAGLVSVPEVLEACSPDTVLVTIMHRCESSRDNLKR
jgi:cysteine desulfurase